MKIEAVLARVLEIGAIAIEANRIDPVRRAQMNEQREIPQVLAIDGLGLAGKSDQQIPKRIDAVNQTILEQREVREDGRALLHQLQRAGGERLDSGLELLHARSRQRA